MSLKNSRVGTTPDLGRISQAMRHPGIDPRMWCSRAYALTESAIDKDHGHFVDVQCLPSELVLTCRVAQIYAGKQFGNHDGLIHKDDPLFIIIPDGDPAHGAIALGRLWCEEDPPPDLVVNNPKDMVRVLEKDTSWRLKLQGSGQWLFTGEDEIHFTNTKKSTFETDTFIAKTQNVRLGDEDASEQLILGTTYRMSENTMNTQVAAAFGVLMGLITTAGASLTTAGPLTLLPPAGVAIAAAGAALTSAAAILTQIQTAISTFDGSATQYLSDVSKTK